MDGCVFCDIISAGKIYKFYEDEFFVAFLDANPVSEGHALLVSKRHFETFFDLDGQTRSALGDGIRNAASILRERLGVKDMNIVNANGTAAQQSVGHFHVHLVPRSAEDGLDLWFHGRTKSVDLNMTHQRLISQNK